MRIRCMHVVLLISFLLVPLSIPADEQEPPATPREIAPEKAQSAPEVQPLIQDAPSSGGDERAEPSIADQGLQPAKPVQTDAKSSSPGQTQPTLTDKDRRWLIRQPSPDSKKAPAAPVKPVKWRDDAQKKNCEATLENLRGAFFRTRYYSIQGDSCACAENAALFLSIYEKAKPSCPENFLINEGYSDRITRNMGWLQALGEKRCLGPGTAPDANAESKAAQNPETPHASTTQQKADADTPLGKPTATPQ